MGEVMDGVATPAQLAGLLLALRMRGETADELAGFALAMRERVLTGHGARRRDRHVRHGRRRCADIQHLDRGRAGGGRRRSAGRQARQSGGQLGCRVGRRARGAGNPDRPSAGRRRGGARARRLRLPLCARLPPGDEACRACSARAWRADRVQPDRSADQPRRRAPAGGRCRRSKGGAAGRAGAPPAGRRARVRRSRRRRSTSCRSTDRASSTTCRRPACAGGGSTRRALGLDRAASDELTGGDAAARTPRSSKASSAASAVRGATSCCSTPARPCW